MPDKIPMTPAGHAALTEEYRHRTAEERPRIIAAISEARAHGDLSENAEYHAAAARLIRHERGTGPSHKGKQEHQTADHQSQADDTTATIRVGGDAGAERVIELASIDRARTVFEWDAQPKPGGKKKSGKEPS